MFKNTICHLINPFKFRCLQYTCKSNQNSNINVLQCMIHTTNINHLFWEKDKKGGYDTKSKKKVSQKELVRAGLKELKSEIRLWKNEVQEKLDCDPVLIYRPGETDVAWNLDSKDALDQWIVTTDKDHGEGRSTAKLEMSKAGFGIFHGNVDMRVPKDGRIKKAGYCNMKSLRPRKSFKREAYLNWQAYNTLVLRVRGDGRSYLLNISTEGYFDIWWLDIYHYVLYTRGGPYWQIAKIPFSKFFLGSKGRVQDRQCPIHLNRVTGMGISVGAQGGYGGPFQLEIDYIGLEFDPSHTEDFAYEMYKTDKYIVAT